MCKNPCNYLAQTLPDEGQSSGIPSTALVTPPTGKENANASSPVSADPFSDRRTVRLILDRSTHILQVVVRDANTEKVISKFPDDGWLEAVRLMRAYDAAIVDCKA